LYSLLYNKSTTNRVMEFGFKQTIIAPPVSLQGGPKSDNPVLVLR